MWKHIFPGPAQTHHRARIFLGNVLCGSRVPGVHSRTLATASSMWTGCHFPRTPATSVSVAPAPAEAEECGQALWTPLLRDNPYYSSMALNPPLIRENSRVLLRRMSIESMIPSNHLILCHPLLLLPSFPASGSFPMTQFFTSGGQSIGASASAFVLPVNIQSWFPLGLNSLILLLSKGLSRVFSSTTESISSLVLSLLYGLTLISIHNYW